MQEPHIVVNVINQSPANASWCIEMDKDTPSILNITHQATILTERVFTRKELQSGVRIHAIGIQSVLPLHMIQIIHGARWKTIHTQLEQKFKKLHML